jgi:ABC-2 type transport system permease protein
MFLPLVIVMGTMVDAIAGERERKTLETLLASRLSNEAILLGKIAATGLYMMAITIGSLLLSLATVNIFHGQGRLLMYPVPLLLAALVFSFFGTGLVASLSVLVSLHAPTVKHAYQRLSLAFLLIMIPLWFVLVPSPLQKRLVEWIVSGSSEQVNFAVVTLIIAGIFAICDAVLFALALKRFNRTQMILD